ncbi:hypothetical protein ILYODFUR_032332 [Ilyodon furcidens]|uniref:Uncharacterized protein n=1 Tax=Ilyodon furcidens TaxID=33524 RepID=A0ABV0TE57_9TELE
MGALLRSMFLVPQTEFFCCCFFYQLLISTMPFALAVKNQNMMKRRAETSFHMGFAACSFSLAGSETVGFKIPHWLWFCALSSVQEQLLLYNLSLRENRGS